MSFRFLHKPNPPEGREEQRTNQYLLNTGYTSILERGLRAEADPSSHKKIFFIIGFVQITNNDAFF